MPNTDPACSAKRRPNLRASQPIGSVPIHMPITIAVIGKVARPLSGASMKPMMLLVETMTVLLPPANACATDSTTALRRASLSSNNTGRTGSATADMSDSLETFEHDLIRKPVPTFRDHALRKLFSL